MSPKTRKFVLALAYWHFCFPCLEVYGFFEWVYGQMPEIRSVVLHKLKRWPRFGLRHKIRQ